MALRLTDKKYFFLTRGQCNRSVVTSPVVLFFFEDGDDCGISLV